MNSSNNLKQKPYIVRLGFCVLLVIICFALGYGLYYLIQIQQFIAASTNQKLSTTQQTLNSNQENILLLGSDNDQKFTGNPLTQTMMVVHIDYYKKEVDMFSIPRDLWVKIPGGNSYGKIDQAAEYYGIPSAIKVVEDTFGIQINHYAWVGLYGFIKSIDAVGGINLDAVHPVLDNSYPTDINNPNPYGYQRLDIQPGMQHMSGEEALQYVRSRHEDLIGDFGRTERQRQLLLTLKQTLFASKTELFNIPKIFNDLKGQVKTDITLTDSIGLGTFYTLNKNSITQKQYTLSPPTYTKSANSSDGQSIIVANATTSSQLIKSIFGKRAGDITRKSLSSIKGVQP